MIDDAKRRRSQIDLNAMISAKTRVPRRDAISRKERESGLSVIRTSGGLELDKLESWSDEQLNDVLERLARAGRVGLRCWVTNYHDSD
jgi:hypothetical protein